MQGPGGETVAVAVMTVTRTGGGSVSPGSSQAKHPWSIHTTALNPSSAYFPIR